MTQMAQKGPQICGGFCVYLRHLRCSGRVISDTLYDDLSSQQFTTLIGAMNALRKDDSPARP